MKILFLTNLSGKFSGFSNIKDLASQDCSGNGLDYPLNLLKELTKYADVDVFSPQLKGYHNTTCIKGIEPFGIKFLPQQIPVPETTDIAEITADQNYDIIMMYAESIFTFSKNFEKCKAKKVLWFLSSPSQILLPHYQQYLKANNPDLVLTVVDKKGTTRFGQEFKNLGLKTEWLPLSVDGTRFFNKKLPKISDICLLGNMNPTVYPFRLKAYETVIARLNRYKAFLTPSFGEEFVKAINISKTFLTCSGIWKFPVMKYFEVMACGTLLLADMPLDAEELGFEADKTFASLDDAWTPAVEKPSYPIVDAEWLYRESELLRLLDWALTHVDERNRIAEAGEKLVAKHHTDKIRAVQLYEKLIKI